MSMNGIAEYMYFSRTIDLTPEKERYLRLPGSRVRPSVFLAPRREARLSSACLRQMGRMQAM